MSVFVPNQRKTFPFELRMGTARERNQRYWPSWRRRGNVSSQASPVSKQRVILSITCFLWSGWCTFFQPRSAISSRVVPV